MGEDILRLVLDEAIGRVRLARKAASALVADDARQPPGRAEGAAHLSMSWERRAGPLGEPSPTAPWRVPRPGHAWPGRTEISWSTCRSGGVRGPSGESSRRPCCLWSTRWRAASGSATAKSTSDLGASGNAAIVSTTLPPIARSASDDSRDTLDSTHDQKFLSTGRKLDSTPALGLDPTTATRPYPLDPAHIS